ncbi:MAG TPA: TetR/AcrR family transcriptional regulator [Spirochaetia bacterium]|nr:TetR/AcrR family transcriptional regulator [Spirochaetia bacterium]
MAKKESPGNDTKNKLLTSARECFARRGFSVTTVEDIVEGAGFARGTFYIYFSNKEDIFKHIYEIMQKELFEQASAPLEGDIYQKTASANRGFLEKYREFKDVHKVLAEVCNQDSHFLNEVKRLRSRFIKRMTRNIVKGVEEGIYRRIDNPLVYAYALGGMVDHLANMWFVMEESAGEKTFDMDEVVKSLTDIWYHALVPDSTDSPVK